MKPTQQLATHLHQVYFGGNWTASNLKDHLEDITLEMATKPIKGLNTILALSFHIHYYLKGTMAVLKGGDLTIRDKYSFDHPNIKTEDEWQTFKSTMWEEAKEFISLIEKLDDHTLETFLAEEKYGTYFRNLVGIIEHTHYHLGQIAIVKKLVSKIN
ncbi:DinB family protein [Winogradskyella ouciana]|uniref:DinB family protein n=1 Tax=Winogradskyella ouciana TaxID=2608631 RepID=UPI003D2E98E2